MLVEYVKSPLGERFLVEGKSVTETAFDAALAQLKELPHYYQKAFSNMEGEIGCVKTIAWWERLPREGNLTRRRASI